MLIKSVEQYIIFRRTLGFILKDDERYLRSFAKFSEAIGDQHVRSCTAIKWADEASTEPQRAVRLKSVVRFSKYIQIEDKQHEIPDSNVFSTHRNRPVPYIYGDREILTLMGAALDLPSKEPLPYLLHTLIGLLASTGLRPVEAINLELHDVTDDGLIIRNSKFRKSRLLPLHETTTAELKKYIAYRSQFNTKCQNVFTSSSFTPLFHDSIYRIFNKILKSISPAKHNAKPRLIDFRHTFATKALISCPEGRDQIGQQILALSTYLGHAHVGCTYWYLENTPELMADIASKCTTFVEDQLS